MNATICRTLAAVVVGGWIGLIWAARPAWGQDRAEGPSQGQSAVASQPAGQPAPAAQLTPGPKDLSISQGRQYTRGNSQFPNIAGPYLSRPVEEPVLSNTPRVEQLVRGGRLDLSLENAIELALENNMDIVVQRYYPWIADTDLLRTEAGNGGRGVGNVALPGVFAAIPALNFDPTFVSTFSIQSRRVPVNNPLTAGTGTQATTLASLFTHSTQSNFSYTQDFSTGTGVALSFNNNRASTTSTAQFLNPSVQTVANITFSQQLMAGFGRLPNQRFLRIARLARQGSNFGFVQSVMEAITGVENNYWELVFARGDVEVKRRSVELAQRLYDDNRRQVEIGTLAPLEIVRAEAQLASAQQDLIDAQTYELQQQISLKSLITKNPLDRAVRDAEVVPTDSAQPPPMIEILPIADAVQEAIEKRPDVQQNRLRLCAHDINIRAVKNALLPTATLSAGATSTGLAGRATRGASLQTGFGDSAHTALTGQFPIYEASLSFNLPFRNRAAQADYARALLLERQEQASLQQLQNTVAVDVQNTQIALRQARAATAAAQKSRELQEQTLAAEQTRFQLGASTIFLVVQAQRDLSDAASAEVRALVDLVKARVEFERAMGRTLEANQINLVEELGVVRCHTELTGSSLNGTLIGQGQRR
jgi:outer membrane protein TolC